ncbi:MAG: GNAT family N-acetyltransferase [Symbiobacteriaceae bacterium]|nr:GNAT family N-acetyltransferase [Symbiobacteriaceae bacterium]
MITVLPLAPEHLAAAKELAWQEYQEACQAVPALPAQQPIPDLARYFEGERGGVVLLENNTVQGYICWEEPMKQQFGTSPGVWSPLHAHGAAVGNRPYLYERLFQGMAAHLVPQGVHSFAISLYCHDPAVVSSFFHNGFGNRCIDAMRETTPLVVPAIAGVSYRLAELSDVPAIVELTNKLMDHLNDTPIFMADYRRATWEEIHRTIEDHYYQYTLALHNDQVIAYFRMFNRSGETFISGAPGISNIWGAFTELAYRGSGVTTGLLGWTLAWLREGGYTHCGVDYESLNPQARHFWQRYFTPYTHTMVRRIDERIVRRFS